jgi:sterol desaturase/sphingolipid hydroxylase (fatty acid hydroxylase superfamily)
LSGGGDFNSGAVEWRWLLGAFDVEQLTQWALQIVLSDAFDLMCIMFLAVGLLEYFFPAQKVPRRHYAFNLAYAYLNVFIAGTLTPILSGGAAYLIQKIGLGLIDLRALGISGSAGSLIAVLVGTLIWDFFGYWQHRLEHANKILWQQHLLHHSDEYMNVTTGARQHFLEAFLAPVFITIPTAILFKVPPVTIAALSLIPYAWIYVAHANINLGFGPFWWLLVSPNYHRVHHSLEREHIDKNFVEWFPIWDIVFGTAVVPRWRESPSTGVAGVSVQTLPQAFCLPFKGWLRMIAARLSAGDAAPRESVLPAPLPERPDNPKALPNSHGPAAG